jgi:rhamnosyltransferase
VVTHSHTFPLGVWFRRYFDTAYALTAIYEGHSVGSSVLMGLRILRHEAVHIARTAPRLLPRYVAFTFVRAAGAVLGHHARRLPRALVRRLSLHRYYWK